MARSEVQETKRHLFGVCAHGCVNAWQAPDMSDEDRVRFRSQMAIDGRSVVEVSEDEFESYRARLGRCSHRAQPVEVVPRSVADALADALADAECTLRDVSAYVGLLVQHAPDLPSSVHVAHALAEKALAAYRPGGNGPKCSKCNDTGWCCADQPDPHRCRCGAVPAEETR